MTESVFAFTVLTLKKAYNVQTSVRPIWHVTVSVIPAIKDIEISIGRATP